MVTFLFCFSCDFRIILQFNFNQQDLYNIKYLVKINYLLQFDNIYNQKEIRSTIVINGMQQKRQKQLKITIVGNSQVGKTTFINSLKPLKSKNKELDKNLDLNSHTLNQINILGEDYRLTLLDIKGSGKHLQKNEQSQWKIFTQKTNIAIIMFDVGNKITFDLIGRYWLNLVQSSIKPKTIVILGNKIDRQMQALTLKSVIQFCKTHDLQLFFASNDMTVNSNQKQTNLQSSGKIGINMESYNKTIIQQIILHYESKLLLQQLKLKKQEQIKKPGFMNRFFKTSSKQQQNSKQKQKQRQLYFMKKLTEMKNIQNEIHQKYQNKFKLINDYVTNFFQKCQKQAKNFIKLNLCQNKSSSQLNLQQMNKNLQNIYSIIQKQAKNLTVLQQNLKIKSQQYQKQVKQKDLLSQSMLKLQKQYEKCKNSLNQKDKQLQHYKRQNLIIKQSRKSLQQQINQISLHSKIEEDQKTDEIARLKTQLKQQQITFKNQIEKQIEKQKLLRKQLQQLLNKQKENLLNQLNQYRFRQAFIQDNILSKGNKKILSSLSNFIIKYHESIKKEQKKIQRIYLKKIYQSDLYDSTSFHNCIDGKQSLLYTLQLQNIVIVIYMSDGIIRKRKGKNGIMILWDKKKQQIQQLSINKNLEFWKYDPISLIFGLNQFVIKFWKYKNMLWLNQKRLKNDSIFLGDHRSLQEILRLQKKQQSLYPITSLQISKVQFLYKEPKGQN